MPIGPSDEVETSKDYLDEQMCFEAWNQIGSVGDAAKELERRGIKNPRTDEPPTRMGIWHAAIRFIAKNMEYAREQVIKEGGEWAEDDDSWYGWIVEKASTALTRRQFREWVQDFQLEEYVPKGKEYLLIE